MDPRFYWGSSTDCRDSVSKVIQADVQKYLQNKILQDC